MGNKDGGFSQIHDQPPSMGNRSGAAGATHFASTLPLWTLRMEAQPVDSRSPSLTGKKDWGLNDVHDPPPFMGDRDGGLSQVHDQPPYGQSEWGEGGGCLFREHPPSTANKDGGINHVHDHPRLCNKDRELGDFHDLLLGGGAQPISRPPVLYGR